MIQDNEFHVIDIRVTSVTQAIKNLLQVSSATLPTQFFKIALPLAL